MLRKRALESQRSLGFGLDKKIFLLPGLDSASPISKSSEFNESWPTG